MRPVEIRQRDGVALAADWPGHVHPVLRRVYAQRGIGDPREVEHRLGALARPDMLGGIDTLSQPGEAAGQWAQQVPAATARS